VPSSLQLDLTLSQLNSIYTPATHFKIIPRVSLAEYFRDIFRQKMFYEIPFVRCVLHIQLLDFITMRKEDKGVKKDSPSLPRLRKKLKFWGKYCGI
jgi:hypothetical protein